MDKSAEDMKRGLGGKKKHGNMLYLIQDLFSTDTETCKLRHHSASQANEKKKKVLEKIK